MKYADKGGAPRNLNRNILKLTLAILAILALAIWIGSGLNIGSAPAPELPPELPPIYPSETTQSGTVTAKLYFRFADDDYLAPQTRTIVVGSDERAEAAVLRELIKGPAAGSPELEAIIHAQTSVVKLSDSGDTLFVTLSPDYLRQLEAMPEDWTDDVALRQEAFMRKRLATLSIIDTLTGMGDYAKVQILIDTEGTGSGKRVSWAQFGFTDVEGPSSPIDALAFDAEVVLDAENTARLILQALIEKDYARVYRFVAAADSSGALRPTQDKLAEQLGRLRRMEGFDILGSTISGDGKSAVVRVNIVYRTGDGGSAERESFPLKLYARNELWKVNSDTLLGVLPTDE